MLKTIENALGFFDSTVRTREKIFKKAKLTAAPSE
jgi:hypothetical protein